MFVRISKTTNSPRKSVRIVATYRENGKVKQKMIHNIGVASSDEEIEKLQRIGYEYIALAQQNEQKKTQQTSFLDTSLEETADIIAKVAEASKRERLIKKSCIKLTKILPTSEVTIDQIEEERRVIDGIDDIFGKTYDDSGFNNVLKRAKDRKLLKDLVLARIAQPSSKNKTQEILSKKFDKHYDLDFIYRLLDKLHLKIETVKKITFDNTLKLSPGTIDIVLFDVTTLYFESETIDTLRDFGFSKDHRFNTTQVVLALATNTDGLPIGYELFKGNTAEAGTLCASIESWRQNFCISSACFIGDRAMMSKTNIDMLKKAGHNYIIAAKLRSMPKEIKNQILDRKNYIPMQFGEDIGCIGEFEYNGHRLIVSYKKSRADSDASYREKIVEKLKKRLGDNGKTKNLITNSGVKKYTTSAADAETILDNDKINRDAEWDGFHGVITDMTELDSFSILQRYSRLWVIEESFRINKHSLSMRPIYHFKQERIESHIALCYMAFAVLRYLQYKISITTKISPDKIIEELFHVQSSIYIHKKTGHKYRIPGFFSQSAKKIYKSMGIARNLVASPYLD